ncbi:MAG: ABC transporter permease [Chloroflexota bacterium]
MQERKSLRVSLRVVWAIAAKDIVDAIKNKTTISIIIGVAFLMLSSQALPLLLKLKSTPTAVVYDAGRSRLLAELKKDRDLRLAPVSLQQEMEKVVGESGEVLLGLVIPADLDQTLAASEAVELDGYLAHWADASDAMAVETFFEDRLTALAGQAVQIITQGHAVYPTPEAGGRPFMIATSLVVTVITICGAMVPFLMIEEKEAHTLDALLVSPASIGQVVVGKAMAGAFYGLLAAGVVYTFNLAMVVHWEVAILAAVSGAAFAVALGLLLGSLFDNVPSMNLWFGAGLLALLVPVLLAQTLGPNVPQIVRTILPWAPSVLLADVVRISLAGSLPWGDVLLKLGIVWAGTVAVLGLVVWRLRLSDR